MSAALLVTDAQVAFQEDRDTGSGWGNPDAEARIADLLAGWRQARLPVVHVHHHGTDPADNFHPEATGAAPMGCALPGEGETLVIKHGSSAFISTGLETLLRERGLGRLVLAGEAANYCVESTAPMAGNLGFETTVAADALINFQKTLRDRRVLPAADVLAVVLATLDGEFARIAPTSEILSELKGM